MTQGAIINQISDSAKNEIEEQIQHLKDVGETKGVHERDYYLAMQAGADTVLNILRRDKICAPGTDNWLRKLSYNQLVYAEKQARSLIAEMDEEARVKIWGVSSEYSNMYHFKTYEEATSKSIEIIQDDASKFAGRRNKISVEPVFVRESELGEYLPNL